MVFLTSSNKRIVAPIIYKRHKMRRALQLTFQKLDRSPLKQLQKASWLFECKVEMKEGQKDISDM